MLRRVGDLHEIPERERFDFLVSKSLYALREGHEELFRGLRVVLEKEYEEILYLKERRSDRVRWRVYRIFRCLGLS